MLINLKLRGRVLNNERFLWGAVVDSTLVFGSIGHGFKSEHRLFSHHGASASLQQAEITGEVLIGVSSRN